MTSSADIGAILTSPIWGVVLGAAAIGLGLLQYRRMRTRKSLAYEVKQIELVSVHRAAAGRIKVLFDQKEVRQAHLVEVRIENNGNLPVAAEDFEEPIVIDLGKGATALTADVVDVIPEDLRAEAAPRDNEVVIEPGLLNPGDSMTLKLFARDLRGKATLHYRIVGISRMDDVAVQRQRQRQKTNLPRSFRTVVRRGPLLVPVASAFAVLAVAPLLLMTLARLDEQEGMSVVSTWGNETLCGKVLVQSDRRIVVQVGEEGTIRAIPLGDVKSIRDDDC